MVKKHRVSVIILLALFLFSNVGPAFSQILSADYLCEIGITFYQLGRYDDALHELKKALIVNPQHGKAKEFINKIYQEEMPSEGSIADLQTTSKLSSDTSVKEQFIETVLDKEQRKIQEREEYSKELSGESEEAQEESRLKVSGEAVVRFGVTSQDHIWKQANWDLNEKNWRILSEAAYNRRENTYDTRVYDRLRLNLDTDNEAGFNFHSTIIVDPWSFTGKTDKVTITSSGGVPAEFEFKYWSNTRYTVDERVYALFNGDTFNSPEIKVVDGKTTPVAIGSNWSGVFTVPGLKIHREFQPMREFWFDYEADTTKFRFFPFAYENQALTFDDPLRLSNKHIWWEESPWLRSWKPGIYNSAQTPVDFTKGYWDKSVSFSARDSEGSRLTQLRGLYFESTLQEKTSIVGSFATPKTLWQNYSEVDNIISALRIKHRFFDNLSLGLSSTMRRGFNLDQESKTDARNYVEAVDLRYEIIEGILTELEFASSNSNYDLTGAEYKTESRGNAFYFSVIGRYPTKGIMDIDYYDALGPGKDEGSFTKFRLFGSHMDEGFDSSLSSYVETRKDEFWSRHLHFRKPAQYYHVGFYGDVSTWDDIRPFRIGDGIDVGRDVLGLRIESSFWDRELENLFDVRNVHDVNGKYIENVARDEVTWQVNDKLTFKALGIYHDLPKTKGGIDPFIYNKETRLYYANTQVQDGKDPSVKTGSFGLEYAFFDWLALNGIWERTNDYYLGYDGFPRSILNSGNNSYTYWEEGYKYRQINNWLYSQELFPNPPYPYYDIFKVGLRLNPVDKMNIYLDYTRNEYEKAGQNDDNINHISIEVGYLPTPKLKLFLKYAYSRWQDLDRLIQGITKPLGHHNAFVELMYCKSEDEDFVFQYGEADRIPMMGEMITIGWDPYGGSLRTIDTQHIFRFYYSRRF